MLSCSFSCDLKKDGRRTEPFSQWSWRALPMNLTITTTTRTAILLYINNPLLHQLAKLHPKVWVHQKPRWWKMRKTMFFKAVCGAKLEPWWSWVQPISSKVVRCQPLHWQALNYRCWAPICVTEIMARYWDAQPGGIIFSINWMISRSRMMTSLWWVSGVFFFLYWRAYFEFRARRFFTWRSYKMDFETTRTPPKNQDHWHRRASFFKAVSIWVGSITQ